MSIQKTADAAAAISVPSAFVSFMAEALPIVQFLAASIAIIAGGFAIAVHCKKLRGK